MTGLSIRGSELFKALAASDVLNDEKLLVILKLKESVKREYVDLDEVPSYFQALSVAIDISENGILGHSFNTLCHFIKRISIQDDLEMVLKNQSYLVLPILITRLGDSKMSTLTLAKQALETYFIVALQDFEKALLDGGLGNRNTPIVVESINFLLHILKDTDPRYKIMMYIPRLCTLLSTNNPNIYLAIEDLFVYFFNLKPNKHYRFELDKELVANNVPLDTRNELMSKILNNGQAILSSHHQDLLLHGLHKNQHQSSQIHSTTESQKSTEIHKKAESQANIDQFDEIMDNSPNSTILSINETSESNITPELEKVLGKVDFTLDITLAATNVQNTRHLNHLFEEFSIPFSGRETEHNWSVREKNILRVRSLLRGNAPIEFKDDLLANLREFTDGFCKSMSSLRTTLSSNGCLLVKDCTIVIGPEFDTVVDSILPTLLKLCSATKQIASSNANMALCSIFIHLPFSHRYLQKFLLASYEKNVLSRSFSGIWMQIYILRFHDYQGFSSAHGASGYSGVDVACKILTKILGDANPTVRQIAKDCFWTFWSKFPSNAESLLSKLEPKIVKTIEKSKPVNISQPVTLPSVTSTKKLRPSLKETIMERNKELRQKQKSASRTSSRSAMDIDIQLTDDKITRAPSRNSSLTKRHPAYDVKSSIQASSSMLEPYHVVRDQSGKTIKQNVKPTIEKFVSSNRESNPQQTEKIDSHTLPKTSIQLNVNHGKHEEDLKSSENMHAQANTDVDEPTSTLNNLSILTDRIDKPIEEKTIDPILNYLLSDQTDVVKEGVSLLKYAIIANEDMPIEIAKLLRKLSLVDPDVLNPLLSSNTLCKRSFKFFEFDDFLRLCSILKSPLDEGHANLLISLTSADELFDSVSRLLFIIINPSDIMDDEKTELAMQIYTHRSIITRFIIDFLLIALEKIAISDSSVLKLTTHFLELVHTLKDTPSFNVYSKLIEKLYIINPVLFKSELCETANATKTEVEIILGIKSGTYTSELHIDGEFTTSTKYASVKEVELSPSKNDFTMLIPLKKEDDEYTCYPKKLVASHSSIESKTSPVKPEGFKLQTVDQDEVIYEDKMDIDVNLEPNCVKYENLNERHERNHLVTNQEELKCRVLGEEEVFEAEPFGKKSSGLGIVECQSRELVQDFSQVKITESLIGNKFENKTTLQLLIEKVDPLKSISSKNRPINIFEDGNGSPQKVRDYNYSDHNWYNYQLSRLSTEEFCENKDNIQLSIDNFKFLCKQLGMKIILDDTFLSILNYIQESNLDPDFAAYFEESGKFEIEKAVWAFFEELDRLGVSQILSGLIIIKLLLVNKFLITLSSVWGLLTKLYLKFTLSNEIYVAVGEVFDEVLAGLYSSKDILHITVQSLQEIDSTSTKYNAAILNCLLKVISMNSTCLLIDSKMIFMIDDMLHNLLDHEEVEIRRLSIEVYGKLYKACKLNLSEGCKIMNDILSSFTTPQRKLINYYSQ